MRRNKDPPLSAPSAPRFINNQQRIQGDNFCQMHKNALLLTTGLSSSELIYAQLKSSFTENPYCILLDHEWKSVVVSIRGTFSLEDCVTDVLIDPESLEQLGIDYGFDGQGQYCHGGVRSCARNVYQDLNRHGLLNDLFLGENALYPHYTLRLVGHSLGAATCTLLSFMLRPQFPSLRVVNYNPPGCSLTWELATKCHSWCTSFVLDSDLVPRLSRESMEHLRDEVIHIVARIKVPKIEIAQRVLQGETLLEDMLWEPDEVPDSLFKLQLERFKAVQAERRLNRGVVRSILMYPPGRMVHLVKTGERKSCVHGLAKCITCFTSNAGFDYTPIYINNDDLHEIVVSPTMVRTIVDYTRAFLPEPIFFSTLSLLQGTDHFPNRIRDELENIVIRLANDS
jgi:sn1-specific diacylglycerol lipase